MPQHDFQIFDKSNYLFKNKLIENSFLNLFFTFVQNFKPKKKVLVMTLCISMFSITLSHFEKNYVKFCIS
jgi:hypothetical protein